MENKFKNSMFGYSKKSVLSFIEEMDVQYHEKMKEADKKSDEKISSLKKEKEELEKTVAALQEKVEALEKEAEMLRNTTNDVSAVFVDAKHFADELKEKAKAEEEALTEQLRAAYEKENERLFAFQTEINNIKKAIRTSLSVIDKELSHKSMLCNEAKLKFNASLSLNHTYRLTENK